MRQQSPLSLDDRLRTLLRSVIVGSRSVEDATLLLRGEIIASFLRGYESKTKNASLEKEASRTSVF